MRSKKATKNLRFISDADDYYLTSSLFCVRLLCPFQQRIAERIFYFMEKKDLFDKLVPQQIGNYKFNNEALLKQAFTRRSYTEENGGERNIADRKRRAFMSYHQIN